MRIAQIESEKNKSVDEFLCSMSKKLDKSMRIEKTRPDVGCKGRDSYLVSSGNVKVEAPGFSLIACVPGFKIHVDASKSRDNARIFC